MPVESFAVEEFAARLKSELAFQLGREKERILAGNYPTFDKYQRQCGVVEGLERALGLLLEIEHPAPEFEEAEL